MSNMNDWHGMGDMGMGMGLFGLLLVIVLLLLIAALLKYLMSARK